MNQSAFPIEAIEAAKNGLEADFEQLRKIESEAVEGARQWGSKESQRTYSAQYLSEKLSEFEKVIQEKAKAIYEPALEHADKLISQERQWSLDGILRRSRVTPLPPPIDFGESGYVSDLEKTLRDGLNKHREILADLSEDIARTRLLTELCAMDSTSFLSSLEDAKEAGDPGLIWMHTLSSNKRSYSSEEERQFLLSECRKAKLLLQHPERERAGEAIEAAKQLKHKIHSLAQMLRGVPNDSRPWSVRILDHAEHEKTVSRYERVNKNKSSRQN
jgi:hypothetical protein